MFYISGRLCTGSVQLASGMEVEFNYDSNGSRMAQL